MLESKEDRERENLQKQKTTIAMGITRHSKPPTTDPTIIPTNLIISVPPSSADSDFTPVNHQFT